PGSRLIPFVAAGPAGFALSPRLRRYRIATIVLEIRTLASGAQRVRAGALAQWPGEVLDRRGLSERRCRVGLVRSGWPLARGGSARGHRRGGTDGRALDHGLRGGRAGEGPGGGPPRWWSTDLVRGRGREPRRPGHGAAAGALPARGRQSRAALRFRRRL